MNALDFPRLRIGAACAAFAACVFAATYAGAQTRREVRRGVEPVVVPAPPVPAPIVTPMQPVPAPVVTPVPPVPAPVPEVKTPAAPIPESNSGVGVTVNRERIEHAQRGPEGRMLRGRNLIGMTIWGENRERLGTVKDFIVDYEGDCPTLYFAMGPEITGWNEEYVIVPFNAFQIGFDERQRHNYFVLGVTVDNLRRAPRLKIDQWDSIHDRNVFTESRNAFQRVERTANRPDYGTRRDSQGVKDGDMRRETDRDHGKQLPAPRGESTERPHAGADRNPGVIPPPKLDNDPGTMPLKLVPGAKRPDAGEKRL